MTSRSQLRAAGSFFFFSHKCKWEPFITQQRAGRTVVEHRGLEILAEAHLRNDFSVFIHLPLPAHRAGGRGSECAGQAVTIAATETSHSADQRCPSLTYFTAISQGIKNIHCLEQVQSTIHATDVSSFSNPQLFEHIVLQTKMLSQ